MGQSISKRLDVPRLSNAMKKYEAEVAKEAMDDVAKRQAIARAKGQKYIDPSAQEAGFKRDTWGKNEGLRTEANQRQFLNDNQKNGKDEMPQDLINFLNDAGPLERKVSKEMTSEKVYESILEEEEQKSQQLEDAKQRKRRRMPMVENLSGEEGDSMEAMTVERTTNFSQAVKEEKDDFKLTDNELVELIWKLNENKTTIDDYLAEKNIKDSVDEAKHNECKELLLNIQKYNEIPILMRDTDKSVVGAPRENIEALKNMNVRMAPSSIQLSSMVELNHNVAQTKKLKEAIILK